MNQQSMVNQSNKQSTAYLEKKSGQLMENLSIIQTQLKSTTDQLEIVSNQYEPTTKDVLLFLKIACLLLSRFTITIYKQGWLLIRTPNKITLYFIY